MNDKEKLQEMLDKHKRYYVYHDFSAQFNEADIEWLLDQVEKMKEEIEILNGALDLKAQEFNIKLKKTVQYEKALREIDTHIRSTTDPVPYIIETLKRVLPEYE